MENQSDNPPQEFHSSPVRKEYIPLAEQDLRQALADWFQVPPTFSETRNIHQIGTLLGEITKKLPSLNVGLAPETLQKGWLAAAGPFLGKQANLLSISKGVAIIQVLQPAIRYHLEQWKAPLLAKLQKEFPGEDIKAVRIRIG